MIKWRLVWISYTCIKCGAHVSIFFKLVTGVRQGGAMSPCLFAIFIDDIVTKLKSIGLGCNTILTCTSIFLYADANYYCWLWPRFNATCANLTTLGGHLLAWVGICRYLGVYFSSARTFNCCFDNCKASFTAHLTPFTVVLVVVLRLK